VSHCGDTIGDGVIGTPSFIHVNRCMSGGEPDEVQDNVILDLITIFIGDKSDNDDGMVVTTGATVWVYVNSLVCRNCVK